ncbi:uncharacterized protein J3R85_011099 [Psidium guajava]|nr:uncharacterized protein J3R85_011099 [Psidium guajava]
MYIKKKLTLPRLVLKENRNIQRNENGCLDQTQEGRYHLPPPNRKLLCPGSLEVHVSIKNWLGSGKNMTLHCRSEDDDLSEQNVAAGSKFGWDFDVYMWGTTLYYRDMGWETLQDYHYYA